MRHKLRNCRHSEEQSVDTFLSELQWLAKRCPAKNLTANQQRDYLYAMHLYLVFILFLSDNNYRKTHLKVKKILLKTTKLAIEDVRNLVKPEFTEKIALVSFSNTFVTTAKKRSFFSEVEQ